MTLLNMRVGDRCGLGVKTERGILNGSAAAEALGMRAPSDMDDLLQNGRGGLRSNLVRAASTSPGSFYMQGETVQFAPVVTRPEKIIMMGFNSRRHAEELGITVRHRPMSVTAAASYTEWPQTPKQFSHSRPKNQAPNTHQKRRAKHQKLRTILAQ